MLVQRHVRGLVCAESHRAGGSVEVVGGLVQPHPNLLPLRAASVTFHVYGGEQQNLNYPKSQ